jgi:hypothetical protein
VGVVPRQQVVVLRGVEGSGSRAWQANRTPVVHLSTVSDGRKETVPGRRARLEELPRLQRVALADR